MDRESKEKYAAVAGLIVLVFVGLNFTTINTTIVHEVNDDTFDVRLIGPSEKLEVSGIPENILGSSTVSVDVSGVPDNFNVAGIPENLSLDGSASVDLDSSLAENVEQYLAGHELALVSENGDYRLEVR